MLAGEGQAPTPPGFFFWENTEIVKAKKCAK
jgi:hypothetical protein